MSVVNRKPNCVCSKCQKAIYRRPSQIKGGLVFCSLSCNALSQQKPKTCSICHKSFIGAKRHCSRSCANISRQGIIYTKENNLNLAYQGNLLKEKLAKKRGGICERCGHNNYTILQVHHKIERYRGGNDSESNLELLCPNCHMTHHQGMSLYKTKKVL